MTAVSAATGLRTWLQSYHFGWLTPRRLRALTLGAMSAAAIVATVGFSGSTPAPITVHAGTHLAASSR
jgi:hypothetical protein